MSFTDRYELGVPLGRNPGGIVYQATRREDGAVIAVAIADGQGLTNEALFEQIRTRFRKDLGALSRARADQIPAVHEVDEDDASNPYAAMERVDGESLATLVEDGIELGELARVIDGVLRALEAAHRVRVVHGDLEPGNVLVAEDGSVRVVGFGLNRALAFGEGWGQSSDEKAFVERSRPFRAPEAKGAPTDARADLYAVGALLHLGLTGEPPSPGRSVADAMPELAASLSQLVDRALEPSPQARYASAWAMRTALGAAVRMSQKGERPSVRPPQVSPPQTAPFGSVAEPGGSDVPAVPKAPGVPRINPSAPPPPPPSSRARSGKKKGAGAPPTGSKRTLNGFTPPAAIEELEPASLREDDDSPVVGLAAPASEAHGSFQPEKPSARHPPMVGDLARPGDSVRRNPRSTPPPVVGVEAPSGSHPAASKDTGSMPLETSDLEPAVAPRAPVASAAPPPPVGERPYEDDEGPPVAGAGGFLRTPVGRAAVVLGCLVLGVVIGRLTVGGAEPSALPGNRTPRQASEVATPAPRAERPPARPLPLVVDGVPDDVVLRIAGERAGRAPTDLPADGSPVRVELQRGDDVVAFSLGAAEGDDRSLSLHVLEIPQPAPEPEPRAAPVPPSRQAAPSRRRRPSASPSPSPSSSSSLMRPGIARDPGF